MDCQIAVYSADSVFARMLELEFLMQGKSVFVSDRPREDLFADVVLLDLDTCTPPMQNTYGRMIGFTANSVLLADEVRCRCSMILHRPFEMRLLRREVLSTAERSDTYHHVRQDDRIDREEKIRITLDQTNAVLMVDGEKISLSPKELLVAKCLIERRGEPVSRELLSQTIGESVANKVEVYVCYLRRKLDQKLNFRLIHTVRGKGYMMK